jgi:hypothetical protein
MSVLVLDFLNFRLPSDIHANTLGNKRISAVPDAVNCAGSNIPNALYPRVNAMLRFERPCTKYAAVFSLIRGKCPLDLGSVHVRFFDRSPENGRLSGASE